jgi:hypothetical protein
MLRVTQDVVELRGWVQSRGGWPVRERDGRITVSYPGDRGRAAEIGWEEFEAVFCSCGWVLVYDDAPGSRRCLVGSVEEARAFVVGSREAQRMGAAASSA